MFAKLSGVFYCPSSENGFVTLDQYIAEGDLYHLDNEEWYIRYEVIDYIIGIGSLEIVPVYATDDCTVTYFGY